MTNFKHEEHLSRQRAAERLVDIAYSLTAGGTLEVRTGGDQVKVPVVDQVLLTRESRTDGDLVEVEVRLPLVGARSGRTRRRGIMQSG